MNFEVKKTNKYGNGLFAKKGFDKDEIILKFKGIKLLKNNIENFYTPEKDPKINSYLQVGSELYLDVSGDHSFFINHSCNPNTIVKIAVNIAFLMANRKILSGEELTFDYSTTSTENPSTWSMNCSCGNFNCRKLITGFQSLSKKDQEKYIENGAVPEYVKNFVK